MGSIGSGPSSRRASPIILDADGLALVRATAKANCIGTLLESADRVAHFVERVAIRGLSSWDVVIVLLNADDVYGFSIADLLMPGENWHAYRDRGEIPFVRGLANRKFITEAIAAFDSDAATKLRAIDGIAVVVVDHGVAEVFRP
jgi:hypothetical protein